MADREKRGLTVQVHNNNINKAWRRLKKLVQEDGLFQEMKEREYYTKPSAKRRKQRDMARKRWLKKKREIEMNW
jgi:small subunit ribosomal protein S21